MAEESELAKTLRAAEEQKARTEEFQAAQKEKENDLLFRGLHELADEFKGAENVLSSKGEPVVKLGPVAEDSTSFHVTINGKKLDFAIDKTVSGNPYISVRVDSRTGGFMELAPVGGGGNTIKWLDHKRRSKSYGSSIDLAKLISLDAYRRKSELGL